MSPGPERSGEPGSRSSARCPRLWTPDRVRGDGGGRGGAQAVGPTPRPALTSTGPPHIVSGDGTGTELGAGAGVTGTRDRYALDGTTILSVRKGGTTVIAGDGQVSLGATVIKSGARKVRRLGGGSVIGGFAGATADAFTCSSGWRGNSTSTRASSCARAWSSPRTGAPTAICAGWRR